MDLASPANGRVYHGEIRNGRWSAVSAAKFMKVGGNIPARTVFATVIPEGAKVQLDAFVDEKTVSRLKAGQKGYVAPVSAPRSRLSVTVGEVASHPAVDGKYHVVLQVGGDPVGTQLVPGMKGKIKLTLGDEGDSLAIPVNALHEEADGSYTVKVKGEDGESSVAVEVGTESSGKIVVLSGLKAGQVIITPDAAKAEEPKKK
jgi:multidrug efflux pump subunit AcrA (membrane-fusion protein)